jgi:hypothetical protein
MKTKFNNFSPYNKPTAKNIPLYLIRKEATGNPSRERFQITGGVLPNSPLPYKKNA